MNTKYRTGISDTTVRFLRIAGITLLTGCFVASYAYADDDHGDRRDRRGHDDDVHGHGHGHGNNNKPYPTENDPSRFGDLVIDTEGDLLEGLPEANEGTFEGGITGHTEDASANNVLQAAEQRDDGRFNVPTNGAPSPLYGAQPFSQQMLRFEEFGPEKLKFKKKKPKHWKKLPAPANAQSVPDGEMLEHFLSQRIWPAPTKFANTEDENPWEEVIEDYIGRDLDDPPAEGRPPGLGWSHQRWEEFKPKTYFQTAQTGARTNGGFRDSKQGHGYSVGEFGPGGLYHNTAGVEGTEGTTRGIDIRFHPKMPIQDKEALWTFDGTLPPKLLNVRYGEPVLMRHYNALPVDVAANRGFGVHTITTHEHNGHNPAESDGYANSLLLSRTVLRLSLADDIGRY